MKLFVRFYQETILFLILKMMLGYFKFIWKENDCYGVFQNCDDDHYFDVQILKLCSKNEANDVFPQFNDIQFVTMEADLIIKVDKSIIKHEIYVVNSKCFISRYITYRVGMDDICD
jgi:hypothetical protein